MFPTGCCEIKMADGNWQEVTAQNVAPVTRHRDKSKHISMINNRTDINLVFNRKEQSLFLLLRIGLSRINSILIKHKQIVFILCCLMRIVGASAQNQYGLIEQKFAMEPQDQTAIVGSRVTLPCRVVGKSGVLQWTKDDFGLGAHRNLSGYDRYSMIGSDEEGDFSLDIYPVHLEDDAKYQCQVSPGPQGQVAIRSKFATVSVLVPPDPPKILQGPFLLTTEDREVEIECVSVGGKPAAEITWIDGEGVVVGGKVEYVVEPMGDGRKFTARSILRLSPRRKHHNSVFTCQAQNTADRTFRAANITLQVKYAPVVSLKIISGTASNGRIPESAEVRLGCKAEANPNDLTYTWYLNDEVMIGDYTTEMILFNVSRKLHDSIIKCEVHNSVGKSEESETLDVTYGPKFRNPPSNIEADLGSTATLTCDLDGNPPPDIVWYHKDQDRWSVVGSTPNLTLTVDTATAGKYNCKASVQGFPEIEAEAIIFLKGPPNIVSHRSQFGAKGDNVRVECLAVAVPRPTAVTWLFNAREINTLTDHDYTIFEDLLSDGIRSTLVIRESQPKHFGSYNCSVTNEYGTDMVEINLIYESTYPFMWYVAISCGAILIIFIMIPVIILCRKKKQKSRSGESKKPDVMADIDKASADKHSRDSDRSSYISDIKPDLKSSDGRCNPEYSSQEYRTDLPLAGPVALPADRAALLMQYSRYSNDYSDHNFPPIEYKDGHNNNGYSGYIDFSREYSPPPLPLHIQSPILTSMDSHPATKIHLPSLQSNNQLNSHLNQLNSHSLNLTSGSLAGSLPRSVDTASTIQYNSGNTSQNNSLQRPSGKLSDDNTDAINSVGLPNLQNGRLMSNSMIGSGLYDSNLLLQNGGLKQNSNSMLGSNGIDIRYSATYGNPYLRTAGGLNTVNTANPAATPAPPPYNSIRNSVIGMGQMGSSSHVSSPAGSSITGASINMALPASSPAQPQAASSRPVPQSPSSQYILPPSSHSNGQLVQLTKKGGGTQPSLATHV